ncbi:redoxin domain-containing protein [Haloarchaeobius amylolyticus]|uniref:redoxin domain-containing protein n=1 Tax=Haloarchaeobius amylolyticus TaxID=1198296 RepID=UPI002271C1CD|nr:redoxin domain-containing protein [Haloarchaeobius amylolyticus]
MSLQTDDIELHNAGAGADVLSLESVADRPAVDSLVVLLMRDYHCPKCKAQARDIARRYDEFDAANAEVIVVLPDAPERTEGWLVDELPYPLLADPETRLGTRFGQSVRFGPLGSLHDFVGRMPVALVLDAGTEFLEPVFTHRGSMPADRPGVGDLLAELP